MSKIIEFSLINLFSSLIIIGFVILFVLLSYQYFDDFNHRIKELTPNFSKLNDMASKRKIIILFKVSSTLSNKVRKILSNLLTTENEYFIIGG